MVAEVAPVAPGIGKEVCGPDRQDDSLIHPVLILRDTDLPTVPAHFITRGESVIGMVHRNWIAKNAPGKIVIVTPSVRLPPGRQRFPAKRDDDLFMPGRAP